MTVPLTGEQYAISAGPYRATVTELGAGLRELLFRDEPVIAGYEADELPPAGAGQLLAPWPNRVDGGRYAFGGTEFQLALSEPALGNAIHGLTRWTAWTAVSHDAGSVLLRSSPHGWQGYPFCLEAEAGFRLHPDRGLHVAITARNRGHSPAPYGTGFHPYLTVRTASVDDCELSLPAASWLPVDDRGIPSGPLATVEGTQYDFRQPRAIGTTRLDTPLTGLDRDERGRAWAHLAAAGGTGARVSLWAGEGYRWLQVFTGDPLGPDRRRKALAVEPMTCPPNAFVTGDDLLVLRPGETVTHAWGIQAWLQDRRAVPRRCSELSFSLAMTAWRLVAPGMTVTRESMDFRRPRVVRGGERRPAHAGQSRTLWLARSGARSGLYAPLIAVTTPTETAGLPGVLRGTDPVDPDPGANRQDRYQLGHQRTQYPAHQRPGRDIGLSLPDPNGRLLPSASRLAGYPLWWIFS